jgi:hypothetical protein
MSDEKHRVGHGGLVQRFARDYNNHVNVVSRHTNLRGHGGGGDSNDTVKEEDEASPYDAFYH